jgi:D-alanyl-D-alanine carboxypeptidase/D-alanyl-D-alanine-endopeptidase (penicillin-binding protein 4)
MKKGFGYLLLAVLVTACSTQQKIHRVANEKLLQKEGIKHAHVGILVYDADQKRDLYAFQSDKYFVPASNTKLVSLYAGMSTLGDSLPTFQYRVEDTAIFIQPSGDPTFLHPDYADQPAFQWLRSRRKPVYINSSNWKEKPFGFGWTWDDYTATYMAERSPMPIYGNLIKWTQVNQKGQADGAFVYSEPEVNWPVQFKASKAKNFDVDRARQANVFTIQESNEALRSVEIPFYTNGTTAAIELLRDTLSQWVDQDPTTKSYTGVRYNRPVDSMYRLMMHVSDNMFAEQTLLLAAQQKLGYQNTEAIIDTLLATSLKGFPQKPNWVDGSGLSRYNLFSPADFVWLLQKMRSEFDWNRLTTILASGNEGTLRNYYTTLNGKLYAKTGTLSGQVALSGFLRTQKGKLLIFSVLVNNHQTTAPTVRKAVESLILDLYRRY